MKHLLHHFKRFLWLCTVGFMIAWYNVFFQDDRLREDDRMEMVEGYEDDVNDDDSDLFEHLYQPNKTES